MITDRFSKPFWNERCEEAVTLRKRAKRRAEKDKDNDGKKIEFKNLAQTSRKILLETERDFWRDFTSKINSSSTATEVWQMAKRMKGKTRPKRSPLISEGQHHYSSQEKANIFTKHYRDTMSSNDDIEYPIQFSEDIARTKEKGAFPQCDSIFTMQEMQNGLQKLEENKAYGTDEVGNEFLKHLPLPKVQELLGLFNRSWKEGKLPPPWKTGLIIPINKPGKSTELPESYRPISLLQCTSKLMEALVGSRLTHIAETNNLIPESQHGFRFGRSAADIIIDLEHEIRSSIATSQVTIVVFFDLKAAYDSVDHMHLIHTLAKCGIGGKMLAWIQDFLTTRHICTQVEDFISDLLEITQGLPQGSGLSTILFILLLSTLPKVEPVKSKEFADDVSYSITAKTLEDAEFLMQDAIERFDEWTKAKGLRINNQKTKVMCFTGKKDKTPRLMLNNEELDVVTTFRYLGFMLDAPSLTWKSHIEHLQSECQSALNVMRSMANTKYGADRESLLNIYQGLIKGKINYSCALLISTSKSNMDKLEVIQNAALRIATGALMSTPILSLQCEAQVPPLKIFIEKQCLISYYRLMSKNESHPVRKYILKEPENQINWRTKFKKPFKLQAEEIIEAWGTPPLRQLSQREAPSIPPWEPLETSIHTELLTPILKSSGMHQLRAEALFTIETKYAEHLQIFTDGSKTSEEHPRPPSTSAGFCVPLVQVEENWKLNANISIAGAELSAIHKATNWILTQTTNTHDKIVILTDSQVSLHLLKHRKPRSYAYSVSKIHKNILDIRNRGWDIDFQWIPSHCGIAGNERADALAADAHSLDNTDNYPIQLEEVYQMLEKTYQNKWVAHWNTHRKPHDLRDSSRPWPHTRHARRPYDVVLTRLRQRNGKSNLPKKETRKTK